jgi:hypothetical protein
MLCGIETSAGCSTLIYTRPVEQAEKVKSRRSEHKYETEFGLIGSEKGNHLPQQVISGLI